MNSIKRNFVQDELIFDLYQLATLIKKIEPTKRDRWLLSPPSSMIRLDSYRKFIPPGGELSVALTRHQVTCGSKPGVGGIFFQLWPFFVTCYLSLGLSY